MRFSLIFSDIYLKRAMLDTTQTATYQSQFEPMKNAKFENVCRWIEIFVTFIASRVRKSMKDNVHCTSNSTIK